ncbi:MAG: TIGR04283 family arsenosugar biosynthesis glycosyltransferase [Gammaproteobacteria bacterium]|nr:MAG: TIGR04283 family arsenosugar biosynthesis glycosyltransferase [Gammaproteobacteria bacterium]
MAGQTDQTDQAGNGTLSVAVIIPVLNEETGILKTLEDLIASHSFEQLIIVDGGSVDNTCQLVREFIDKQGGHFHGGNILFTESARGRAVQMNAGSSLSDSGILVFLHADTVLPQNAIASITDTIKRGALWGRFAVTLGQPGIGYRMVAAAMNLRSRISGITTGDQALFVRRDLFRLIGGYPVIPLMEDIVLSKRLKEIEAPVFIKDKVITSARRWQQKGILLTILSMWLLRFLFWTGVSPARLARHYPDRR